MEKADRRAKTGYCFPYYISDDTFCNFFFIISKKQQLRKLTQRILYVTFYVMQ